MVAVDRKGRVLVLSFPLKSPAEQQAMQAQYAGYGVQRQPSTMTHMSNGTHGYYAGTPSYNASMSSFQAPTNMSAISLMSPMPTDQTDYGGFF